MQDISLADQLKIKNYLQAGQKIAAVRHFRKVTGCSLSAAVAIIDDFLEEQQQLNPYLYQQQNVNRIEKKRHFALIIVLLLVVPIVITIFNWQEITGFKNVQALQHYLMDQVWAQNIKKLLAQYIDIDEEKQTLSESKTTSYNTDKKVSSRQSEVKKKRRISPVKKPTALEILEKQPRPHLLAQKIYPLNNYPGISSPLHDLYQLKLANYNYQDWKSLPGLPKGYQDFPEEFKIKGLRFEIAAKQEVPNDVQVNLIPPITGDPHIDGKIESQEWTSALKLSMQPFQKETTLYFAADDNWLYIAADVPSEITKKGFDQFRFYFHVDLTDEIRNERVHISGYGGKARPLGGIRQTAVRWYGEPAANHEQRWKKYPISDWQIYRHAEGASYFGRHRQYEGKISLQEAGLHPGVGFKAYAIVETDPLRKPDGKFKKRQYAGQLGSQKKPQWFMIKLDLK